MISKRYQPAPVQYFTCGKCKARITETACNAHLQKCQPHGSECGRCKKLITDPDFVAHYKNCKGKLETVAVPTKQEDIIDLTPVIKEKG